MSNFIQVNAETFINPELIESITDRIGIKMASGDYVQADPEFSEAIDQLLADKDEPEDLPLESF